MSRRRLSVPLFALLITAVCLTLSPMGQSAFAAEADQPSPAAKTAASIVPADAAFFGTNLRLREQYDLVVGSKAWKKLTSVPAIQMAWGLYQLQAADPQSPPGQVEAFIDAPENRPLMELLRQMGSEEIFIYGEQSCVDTMDLMQQIAGAMRYGPAVLQLSGAAPGYDEDELQGMLLLTVLHEELDLIKVPAMVMGFRIHDAETANEQIDRLEGLVKGLLEQNDDVKVTLGREDVDGQSFLTLRARAEDLPWDEVPVEELKQVETEPNQVRDVLEAVRKLEVVVALGVRGDYVLLSVGPSTEVLAALGGEKNLADRKEFRPLKKFADQRITAISYLSQEMAQRMNDPRQQVDDALEAVEEILPSTPLAEEDKQRLLADARELASDLRSQMPEPGAVMGFSLITGQGIEQYVYNWTSSARIDPTQPLTLLRHIGGDPLLAVVGRGEDDIEQYELLTKWLAKGIEYFRDFALKQMGESDREQAEKVMDVLVPALADMDKIMREKFLPGMADGQNALIIDGRMESTRYHQAMPEADEALPMVEPALVFGVADAKLVRQGIEETGELVRKTLDKMKEKDLADLPEQLPLPPADVIEEEQGTLCCFHLPEELGLDEQIEPTAALNDEVAVLAMSRDHAKRLLESRPPTVGGVLTDVSRPRGVAQVFHWKALLEAVKPWVTYAIDQSVEEENQGQARMVAAQVFDVLDVLAVFETITSETYKERDAWVSHTLIEVNDLQ